MAFRFDKLTVKAQEAVAGAQSMATDAGHPQVDPLHLLAALVERDGRRRGPSRSSQKIGANRPQLEQIIQAELGPLRQGLGRLARRSPAASWSRVLEAAQREADTMKDEFVSTEHLLLLALAKIGSKARKVLELNAITDKEILEALRSVRGSARVEDQNPGSEVPGAGAVRDRPGGTCPAGASSTRLSAATRRSVA